MTWVFVFAHGWGSNQLFWQNLQPLLTQNKDEYYFCDFGYFNNGVKNSIEDLSKFVEYHRSIKNKVVAVGHSLGFSKLLMMDIDFDYYLGLQTFVSFIGRNNSLAKHFLEKYKLKFWLNPFKTFSENYDGFRDYFKNIIFDIGNINFDNVYTDFKLLERDISKVEDLFNRLNKCNYHIIASKKDPVVLFSVVKENFPEEKITVVEETWHLLGLLKPEIVRDILLEKLKSI